MNDQNKELINPLSSNSFLTSADPTDEPLNHFEKLIELSFYNKNTDRDTWYKEALIIFCALTGGPIYFLPGFNYGNVSLPWRIVYGLCTCIPAVAVFYFVTDMFFEHIYFQRLKHNYQLLEHKKTFTEQKVEWFFMSLYSFTSSVPLGILAYIYKPTKIPEWFAWAQAIITVIDSTVLRLRPTEQIFSSKLLKIASYIPFVLLKDITMLWYKPRAPLSRQTQQKNSEPTKQEPNIPKLKKDFIDHLDKIFGQIISQSCEWTATGAEYNPSEAVTKLFGSQNANEWLENFSALSAIDDHHSDCPSIHKNWKTLIQYLGVIWLAAGLFGYKTISAIGFYELFNHDLITTIFIAGITNYFSMLLDVLLGQLFLLSHIETLHKIFHLGPHGSLPFHNRLFYKTTIAYAVFCLALATFGWTGAVNVIEDTLGTNQSILFKTWAWGAAAPTLILLCFFSMPTFFDRVLFKIQRYSNTDTAKLFQFKENTDDLLIRYINDMTDEAFITMIKQLAGVEHLEPDQEICKLTNIPNHHNIVESKLTSLGLGLFNRASASSIIEPAEASNINNNASS